MSRWEHLVTGFTAFLAAVLYGGFGSAVRQVRAFRLAGNSPRRNGRCDLTDGTGSWPRRRARVG
ncbi:hypothetical protein Kpho01_70160 [Kitasatospora phosalacinea]|uniref:Uncharacterized protein n=1 Tax=Kitasatospora phosalacinea TaxID=2065 RepID=A0A9W6UQY6_9ACTN|nr:hypothetical protein Kpho01_70160 [Kitasatospora phosalacinea]